MNLKRRNKANPEFSLAAMVDVILLLLIFFMVTSAASNQSAIEVKLPQGQADNAQLPDPITVTVRSGGEYFVDDRPVAREAVEQAIVAKLQGRQNPSFTIRADENSLHKDVVYLMEIAEKHKYSIAIATTKDK